MITHVHVYKDNFVKYKGKIFSITWMRFLFVYNVGCLSESRTNHHLFCGEQCRSFTAVGCQPRSKGDNHQLHQPSPGQLIVCKPNIFNINILF